MAGNQFLTEIDLEFHGNFDEIAAQADAALQKIARSAAEVESSGGSTRGLGPAVQEVGRRVGAAAVGFGPEELRALQKILTDHQNAIRQSIPRNTGRDVDVAANAQRAAQQQQQQADRRAQQEQTRNSERLLAIQRQKDNEQRSSEQRARTTAVQPAQRSTASEEKPKAAPAVRERPAVVPVAETKASEKSTVASQQAKESELDSLTKFAKQQSYQLPVRTKEGAAPQTTPPIVPPVVPEKPPVEPAKGPEPTRPVVEQRPVSEPQPPKAGEPTVVKTIVEPAIVKPVVETATVKPVVEPTDIKPTVETPVVKPTVEPTTVKPTVESAVVKPVVEPTTVKPTVESTVVKPTVDEPVVKPVVEPVVVKPTVEPVDIKPKVDPAVVVPLVEPAVVKPVVEPAVVKPVVEPTTVKPTVEPTDVKPTVEQPVVKPTVEIADVKPVVEAAVVKPIVEPTEVKPTVDPVVVKPTVEPTAVKPTVEPAVVKPTVQPTDVKPTVEPAIVKPVVEPATVKPTVEPAIVKPVVEPADVKPVVVKPTVEPTSVKPIVEPSVVKPLVVEPVIKPVVEPTAVKPTVEPTVVKPTVEQPVVKPTVEPADVKPVVEQPVVKPTVEPIAIKSVVQPVAVKVTVEPAIVKPTVEPAVVKPVVEEAKVATPPAERVIREVPPPIPIARAREAAVAAAKVEKVTEKSSAIKTSADQVVPSPKAVVPKPEQVTVPAPEVKVDQPKVPEEQVIPAPKVKEGKPARPAAQIIPTPDVVVPKLDEVAVIPPVVTEKQHSKLESQIIPTPDVVIPKLDEVHVDPPVVTEKQHSKLEPQIIPQPEVKPPATPEVVVPAPHVVEEQAKPLAEEVILPRKIKKPEAQKVVIPAPAISEEPFLGPVKPGSVEKPVVAPTVPTPVVTKSEADRRRERNAQNEAAGVGPPPPPRPPGPPPPPPSPPPPPPPPPGPPGGPPEPPDDEARPKAEEARIQARNVERQRAQDAARLGTKPKDVSKVLKEFDVVASNTDFIKFAYEQTQVRKENAVGSHLLATSPTYLDADTKAQTEAAILNAKKTESLNNPRTVAAFVSQDTQSRNLGAELDKARVGSEQYKAAILKAAEQANSLAASINEAKSINDGYKASVLRVATAANQEAAAIDEAKAADTDAARAYRSSHAEAATQAARSKAAETQAVNNPETIGATVGADTQSKNLAAELDKARAGSQEYRAAIVKAGEEAGFLSAIISEAKAVSADYNASLALAATANKREAAARDAALAGDKDYLASHALEATGAATRKAAETKSVNNPQTRGATVEADTQSKELAASLDSARAGSAIYRESIIHAAEEANILAAIMSEARAGSENYNTSVVLAATAAKTESTALNAAKAGDDDYLKATAADAVAKKQLAASEELATQNNEQYAAAIRDTISATKRRAAIEAEAAGSQANVSNDARAEVARRRGKLNTQAQVAQLTTPQDTKNEAAGRLVDARQKLAVQYEVLAAEMPKLASGLSQDASIEAKIVVLKNAQAKALSEQVAELQGQKATAFQTLRHSFRSDNDTRSATQEQTLGKFVGQHATSTLGYAIPGIAIGIGFTELERSVKEAEQAQRDIAEVKAEFEGLGQQDQFAGFAGSIKSVSNATGLAVTEVSQLALAMKGVFGDTNQANIALRGIAQGAVAMDLPLKEAETDITAITQAFGALQIHGGSAVQQVTNELLHLQDLSGVQAKRLAPGVADAAPSADQLKIPFKQTASIIAAASQRSGLDPQVIGQTFSKLLDGVSQNLAEIFAIYQQTPGLAAKLPKLAREAPAQQIPQILTDYGKFGPGEQIAIQRTLGINASAVPALNALTQSGPKAAGFEASATPANRTQQEFEKQIATLQGHFQRLQQAAANFGIAIINSGVGKAIGEIAAGFGGLLHILTDLNSTTHGFLGVAVSVGAVLLGWKIATSLLSDVGKLITVVKGLGASTAATSGILATESATEGANALAANADAAATGRLAAAEIAAGGAGAAGALGIGGSAILRSAGTAGALGAAGTALLPSAGVAAVGTATAAETAAAVGGRGLFQGLLGFGGIGAGVGVAGLGGLGASVGLANAVPAALIAGLAGFGAFKGTTAILDTVVGKPKSIKPTTHLTSDVTDFVKNNQERINLVEQAATVQQATELQKDARKKNNLDFLRLYNQVTSSGEAKVVNRASTAQLNQFEIGGAQDINLAKHGGQDVAKQRQQVNAYLELLASREQIQLKDFAGVQTGYQAGTQSFAKLLSAAQANVTAAQDAYNAQGTGGTTAEFEALQTAIQQKNAIFDQQAQQAQQFFASLQKQGSTQADVAIIRSLTTEKQLGPQAKLSQAQAIVQAYQQQLQDEAALATSTAQRNAILQRGIQVSPANLAVINKDRAANGLTALKSLTVPGQQVTPTQTFQAAQEGIQASQSLAQAAAFEDPIKLAKAAIAAGLQQQQAYLTAGGKQSDPQFQQLAAGVKEASHQLIDANNAIVSAQIGLTKAFDTASGDVVAQARDDLAAAQQAYASAHGTAEKLAAQAQIVAANREAVTAVNTLSSAQASLVTALATATGDPSQAIAAAQNATATAAGAATRIAAADQAIGKNPNNDTAYLSALAQYYQSFQQQVQARTAAVQATGDLLTAQAREDPLAIAAAAYQTAVGRIKAVLASGESTTSNDYKQAQAAAISAGQQFTDQIHAIQAAQVSVWKASDTAAGDVLGQAKDDQLAADVALASAHGRAAQLAAQAQKIAANREVTTAMNQIATAQAGLLTAMANATGDPRQIIAAAQHAASVDLSNANRIKAADQALGRNPNNDQAYVSALTQYYNDRATAANTVAQQTISETETLLFLGKETATQAIAQLEAALPAVRGNIQATNQILTEIRQIQNSAGANLNFDLPSTLLPSTLYEARRLESNGPNPPPQGGPVTIQINVNGGSAASINSAVSKLTQVVGGPQRTGTQGPLLNG